MHLTFGKPRLANQAEINILDDKLKEDGKYFDKESMSIKDIVNEPAFKVGDWVLITKPKDVNQKLKWNTRMDRYNGRVLMIQRITDDGYFYIDYWNFHPDWCTKAEAPKPFKVGDICIFWDDNKSNAIIGKLTSIDMSDYPYEVGSMWSYEHCIKFESMEQYNKFIEE